jgi:hypothetical protein
MQKFYYLTLALVFFVCGCASVPMASQNQDQSAKNFAVVSNKAHIYLFRKSKFTGSAVVLPVMINQKIIGGTKIGTYFFLEVDPGTYAISSQNISSMPSINLKVEAGKNYFIEQNFHTWYLTPTVTLDLVDESQGKAEILKCQLLTTSFVQ